MYYNSINHRFFQYNPKGAVWGNIVWAHSISTDLINWKALEPAILPSNPFDLNGCWSGSATILPGNKPVILYTGVDLKNHQVHNIALPKNLSDPYLREWVKPDYNPIIDPDERVNASAFRDPTTAWFGSDGRWRIVIGSRRKDRGMAILYRSKDFIHWTRAQHPFHSANGTGMWECPDFYPVSMKSKSGIDTSEYGNGLKYVLKNSLDVTRYEYYIVGSYRRDLDRYIPDGTTLDDGRGLRYDYVNFYASKTFFDAGKKRRILWGWTNESDSRRDDASKGWAGLQAIPRAVWLDSNGRQLIQWPVEELEGLRGKSVSVKNKTIKSGGFLEIPGIMTTQADVEVIFQLSSLSKAEHFDPKWTDPQKLCEHKGANVKGGVGPFGLLTLASAMREEHTAVYFIVFKAPNKYVALLCHDPSRSTIRPGLYKPTFGGWVDADIQQNGKIFMRNLGGTLYTTLTADSHSIFLELLRLFFNGSTELHFANFLHMVTTMAESGSTSENILNSQKIPVGEYPMAATIPYGSEKYAVGEYLMAATVNNPNLEASSKMKNELNDSVLFTRPERDRLCYQTHYDDNQFWKTGRLREAIAYNFFISKLGPENVKWVNEGNEIGLPYDLIIGVDESSKEYIEV